MTVTAVMVRHVTGHIAVKMNCLLAGNHLAVLGSEGESELPTLVLRFACTENHGKQARSVQDVP